MQNTIIRKYHVWFEGKRKSISTDNIDCAEKKAILNNGIIFEDMRYNGRKRLQRIYFTMKANGRLPFEIDYPQLLN